MTPATGPGAATPRLNKPRARPMAVLVRGHYRPLSAAQRADHLEALRELGRLVVLSPSRLPFERSFVVMSAWYGAV